MRYRENKHQSSEILRMVLPLMARQNAALHPMSYAIWYEHVAGINPTLTQALEARLAANTPLNDNEIYDFYAQHILGRDMQILETLRQKLRAVLEETAQAAAAAGEDTGRYSITLEETQSRITGAVSPTDMNTVIAALLRETLRMETVTRTVSRELDAKAQEVNSLTQQLEQAQTEALFDPLTGLKNRRGFERASHDLLEGTESLDGIALLLADVDHFKQVNDTHGHLLGDKVLRTIGRTLQANIKGRDIAARLGGEEFGILLVGTTREGARILAEQIRMAIAAGRIRTVEGNTFVGAIKVSMGVSIGKAGDTLESLLARADAALYEAKRGGRNRTCLAVTD